MVNHDWLIDHLLWPWWFIVSGRATAPQMLSQAAVECSSSATCKSHLEVGPGRHMVAGDNTWWVVEYGMFKWNIAHKKCQWRWAQAKQGVIRWDVGYLHLSIYMAINQSQQPIDQWTRSIQSIYSIGSIYSIYLICLTCLFFTESVQPKLCNRIRTHACI